jgi:exopolysaccharide biosynthesis protein
LFEIFFIAVTSLPFIYYGPFANLRKNLVGTAMSTMTKRYIATFFLSDERITNILASNQTEPTVAEVQSPEDETFNSVNLIEQNEKDINIPTKQDDTLELFKIEGKKSKGYLLVIKDPTRVRVGYTNKLRVEGQKTSEMAKAHNAVAAINGGSFFDQAADGSWVGTGGLPGGIIMKDGEIIFSDRKNNDQSGDTIALTYDGKLIIGSNSINDLKKKNVRDAICFSPTLIVNGKRANYDNQGLNPRTAIAQRKDGAILFLVMDGRQAQSVGASLDEVTNILLQQNAWNAINLDGGSSTTMYYNGEIVNNPCDPYGERSIATSLYVEP